MTIRNARLIAFLRIIKLPPNKITTGKGQKANKDINPLIHSLCFKSLCTKNGKPCCQEDSSEESCFFTV